VRRNHAVSIAESVLAVFLLSLTVVLIFNLFPRSMATLRVSGQKLQADAVADSVLEEYMVVSFKDLRPGPPQVLPKVPGRGTEFEPSVEIFDMTGPVGVDPTMIKRIKVTVRWKDRNMDHVLVREMARTNVRR
jgi:hypothetical protein